ncbi:MAG: helix-turn-helix transcriptional regulator [Chloroflexota bacterium]
MRCYGLQLERRPQFQWEIDTQARWEELTSQEQNVLSLLASGKSNKEIATHLNVTPRTVEFHVSNILGKLAVTSRVEAALWLQAYQSDIE